MKSAIVVVVAATVLWVAPSRARGEDKVKARAAYEQATQHYELGEYREALEGFKEAYRQYAEPAFLFNLAQCRRHLGDNAQAVRDYRMYLTKVPDAPNRTEVEAIVERLERAGAGAPPSQEAKPQPVAPPTPTPTVATPAPAGAAPAPATAAASPLLVARPAPESQRAAGRKKLIVGLSVAGGLVVAGAIVVGVVLGTSAHDPKATLGTFPVQ